MNLAIDLYDKLITEDNCNVCKQYRKAVDRVFRLMKEHSDSPYIKQSFDSAMTQWEQHCISIHDFKFIPNREAVIPRDYKGAFAD